ncbi:MAG: photosynthetic complex assembly protein PuhC [Pseudomonadota bacterium]
MNHETPIPEDQRTDRITGIHRWPLIAAACLPLLTLGVVAYSQATKSEVAVQQVVIEASRDLAFKDHPGGIVEVIDAATGTTLRTFKPGKGAFLRQSMRALVTTRRRKGVDRFAPYRVQRSTKGMLSIYDPLTDTSISLNAFGKVANEDYAPLLDMKLSEAGDQTTKPTT